MSFVGTIVTMKTDLWRSAFTRGALMILASSCLAQKIPVVITAPIRTTEDQTAIRFTKSLADEIQLSGKFYYWKDFNTLPSNGIRIELRSIQIKIGNDIETGSAIFVEAVRPSAKDPGYYKEIAEQMYSLPKDSSVADETREFLASVSRELDH